MKIKKPTNAQLATIGAVAGVLGLALGGAALADGMARDDGLQGPRPYSEVVAADSRLPVPPPPPAPPAEMLARGDGPPRIDAPARGTDRAGQDARRWNDDDEDDRWDDDDDDDDDRRGPPHRRGDDRPRAQTWVLCDIERDGDVDCDEDDWRGAENFRPDRDSRGSIWVRCEVERDGDIDCDEDDRSTWGRRN